MSEKNITDSKSDDLEQHTETVNPPASEAEDVTRARRRPRSIVDGETAATGKSGTGGLDSLGGGRLP
jgi:hypothetical protein